ncbi:ricin B-like lectins [Clavulina sp. PMI_390]|nr:ricin B-like lectins [Clavulina sp. PMI_390]
MSFSVGGVYTITNKATGTVADWNQTDLKSLIGWRSHGGNNQKWLIEDAGNGLYYLRSLQSSQPYMTFSGSPVSLNKMLVNSSKFAFRIIPDSVDSSCLKIVHPSNQVCLDMSDSSSKDGNPIILYSIHTGRNQAWVFTPSILFDPDVSPFFFLTNNYTGTVADLSSNSKNVVGGNKGTSPNQIWTTEAVNKSQNLYYIRNVTQGTYLSINGAPSATNPLLSTTTKQVWEIRPDSKDGQLVRIYYPLSNYLVDLTASDSRPGTAIIVYPTQTPGLNQQWKIEPAT